MIERIKSLVICSILFLSTIAGAQTLKPLTTLSIDECYTLAKQQYPLIKQKALIEKSKEFTVENLSKGYLPQLTFTAQATYQSDVTKAPIQQIPGAGGTQIAPLSKDQYKVLVGELNQTLFDGGVIRQQKQSQEVNAIVEEQTLEVELYKLNDRINQLFFGALLVDEQLAQTAILKKDIEIGIQKTEASIANGTVLKSSLDVLKAELLETDQHVIELNATRRAFLNMLGLFINQTLDNTTTLQKPQSKAIVETINRPELALYDYRKKSIDIQSNLITAMNRPKVSFFFQGGYGRPGLDFLKNEFDFYYIGGIRFNWSLSGFYTANTEKQLLQMSKNSLDVQRETFLFNTNLTLKQQNAEIVKLQDLIIVDGDIIALREKVKIASKAQLENGVITSNDYLREVNAEDRARQNLLLHRVQLLMSQYNYKTTAGY